MQGHPNKPYSPHPQTTPKFSGEPVPTNGASTLPPSVNSPTTKRPIVRFQQGGKKHRLDFLA
jgi:hypothetical protein